MLQCRLQEICTCLALENDISDIRETVRMETKI